MKESIARSPCPGKHRERRLPDRYHIEERSVDDRDEEDAVFRDRPDRVEVRALRQDVERVEHEADRLIPPVAGLRTPCGQVICPCHDLLRKPIEKIGAPERSRTPNPQIRSLESCSSSSITLFLNEVYFRYRLGSLIPHRAA
jgi:hypothetical protein